MLSEAVRGCQVLATGLQFPEGPAFDGGGALWCVKLQSGSLTSLSGDGAPVRYPVGGAPNGLAFDVPLFHPVPG